MPTYEYLCETCKHQFELFQSITASAKRKCPECGKMTLKRLLGTGAGIIFKGSGFYQTDYRSEGYKEAVKKEKDQNSQTVPAESKSETKSDKTDTKPKESKTTETASRKSSKKKTA